MEEKRRNELEKIEEELREYCTRSFQNQTIEIVPEFMEKFEIFLEAFPSSEYWSHLLFLKLDKLDPKQLKLLNTSDQEKILTEFESLLYKALPESCCLQVFNIYLTYLTVVKKELEKDVDEGYKKLDDEKMKKAIEYIYDKVCYDFESTELFKEVFVECKKLSSSNSDHIEFCRTFLKKCYNVVSRDFETVLEMFKEFESINGIGSLSQTDRSDIENVKNKNSSRKAEREKNDSKYLKKTYFDFSIEGDKHRANKFQEYFPKKSKQFEHLLTWLKYISKEKIIGSEYGLYAYKKSLVSMRYSWIVWYDYMHYLLDLGKDDMAITILGEARKCLPSNMMIAFSYADLLELKKSDPTHVYNEILERYDAKYIPKRTLIFINKLKFFQRFFGPVHMRKEFVKMTSNEKHTFHLLLFAASVEKFINSNTVAATRILEMALSNEEYYTDRLFLKHYISLLIKFNAGYNEDTLSLLSKAYEYSKEAFNDRNAEKAQIPQIFRELLNYLQYCPHLRDFKTQVENDILRLKKEKGIDTLKSNKATEEKDISAEDKLFLLSCFINPDDIGDFSRF